MRPHRERKLSGILVMLPRVWIDEIKRTAAEQDRSLSSQLRHLLRPHFKHLPEDHNDTEQNPDHG